MNPPPYAPDRSSSSRLSFRPSNDSSTSRLAPLPSYQASLSSPSFVSSSQCLSASDHITPAPDLPWLQIGSAQDHLLIYLEDMYWQGVRRDLEVMILTLKKWQQPPCDPVILDDEQDDFIYGFDTFIDQVSERSREFATQYGHMKDCCPTETTNSYENAIRHRSMRLLAEVQSSEIKASVRTKLEYKQQYDVLERRAKMLLQSAGFLDIDKLIEHRPSTSYSSSSKRLAAPQLKISRLDKSSIPRFSPLQCSDCNTNIYGCLFTNTSSNNPAKSVCEGCYRERYYGNNDWVKSYKHSILPKAIGPHATQNICVCGGIPDSSYHRTNPQKHCGLKQLGERVARAKYKGMRGVPVPDIQLSEKGGSVQKGNESLIEKNGPLEEKGLPTKNPKLKRNRLKGLTRLDNWKSKGRTADEGSTSRLEDISSDEELPPLFEPSDNKYSFEKIHMALRVGPLIIENGVAHTKEGALIAIKEPSLLQPIWEPPKNSREYNLAVAGEKDRTLWSQTPQPKRIPKRYKAVMKQVVGIPFSGLLDQDLERNIIFELVHSSAQESVDPGLHATNQRGFIDNSLTRLVTLVKALISSRVKAYLQSITALLLSPSTNLEWSATSNNCQNFCDSLINLETFGEFIPLQSPLSTRIPPGQILPLYLMSFVSRSTDYINPPPKSKFDVPGGLTEEYLFGFNDGRHDESDIIDSLQGYWHDWGAFEGNLYKYQDLFPWDCTEAFDRHSVPCNECNLAKHVWAFPFDSWSIASLHLTRDKYLYSPTSSGTPHELSDEDWMRNRLQVLIAQDSLFSAAAAMVKSEPFLRATSWLNTQSDPTLDRLKLGGIHRAQPFSHDFDKKRAYKHLLIAEWAHLEPPERISVYETLRHERMIAPDFKPLPGQFFTPPSKSKAKKSKEEEEAEPMAPDVVALVCALSFPMDTACAGDCAVGCGGGDGGGGCGGGGCGGGGCG